MNAPFRNILHASNLFQPLPDPAWALGLGARVGLNHLRDHLRHMMLIGATLDHAALQARLQEFMRRTLALLTLSFDDDKAVLDGAPDDATATDTIGVTIAHQLSQIFQRADDLVHTLHMHEDAGLDVADFAERAELQIASLIHGHFIALEMTDV